MTPRTTGPEADDDGIERCPECHMPLTMHHDPGCNQPCGRCEASRPEAGTFRVAIRIERPDGQFVTSETTVPADLMTAIDRGVTRHAETTKVMAGFVDAYRRAAELPE